MFDNADRPGDRSRSQACAADDAGGGECCYGGDMIDWTKPRAYIVRMSGHETAALTRASQEKADEAYRDHLEKLRKKYGG